MIGKIQTTQLNTLGAVQHKNIMKVPESKFQKLGSSLNEINFSTETTIEWMKTEDFFYQKIMFTNMNR